MGSLILAGLIIPLFIYKTVKLYVKKLNISTRIGYIEMICLGLLLALSCYPIYLLMKILDVGFPIVETVCLIFGVLAVFLEVRNCKLANFIYPILLILQFVIYVLFIIELRSSVIPVSIGILLALLSQITILIRFLKDKFLIKRRSWSKTNS